MELKTFAIFTTIALSACAAPRTDPALNAAWKEEANRTVPVCSTTKECEVKWGAAREYVIAHSDWKIQRMTPDFIETFGPPTGVLTLGWRIVKKPNSDGSYDIEPAVWCNSSYNECTPSIWLAMRDFNRFVNASWKPS